MHKQISRIPFRTLPTSRSLGTQRLGSIHMMATLCRKLFSSPAGKTSSVSGRFTNTVIQESTKLLVSVAVNSCARFNSQ
ncbi:hypothetical protein Agabi119p4_5032 [Agaricus bisporus var. burnettii]|uniref:Uncharacterized protein n=1 Tax=Agaricus bisporus var. burnettii TaxID=192524 RepID=A0A8H7KHH9_AGABI|nr:hypothetical protein Agabi119p4_5032 [Agaricus bisporus var. burnettii]